MAPTSSALTSKVQSGSPYQLDKDQVTRASSALLRHIKSEQKEKEEGQTAKKNLLAGSDDEADSETDASDSIPIWLVLTTKKHVVYKNRLKPGKISIPHSLNSSPSISVCLITADPQRAVKDVVESPAFPSTLSSQISKVIGYSKLKTKYKSFESRRQLLSEHDVFLADDRIIMRLVETLGKVFYKSSKRPIPIRIAEIEKVNGKRVKNDGKKKAPQDEKYAAVASPAIVAKEIEKTLNCAAVHLAPSTTSAVRVGSSNFTKEQLVENVEAVVQGMAEKYVTKGWRNIKAVHIKGANTMAMPIWLANELWVDDEDVREPEEVAETKALKEATRLERKRKRIADKEERSKKYKSVDEDDGEAESRKLRLQQQKAKALEDAM
ncbi:hypothetical protein FQN54_004225 [Arachnomyces sp. PD_36]|nr:hypothetical protein FQN54_004225 [Arachnomyces sp. PD_36]